MTPSTAINFRLKTVPDDLTESNGPGLLSGGRQKPDPINPVPNIQYGYYLNPFKENGSFDSDRLVTLLSPRTSFYPIEIKPLSLNKT